MTHLYYGDPNEEFSLAYAETLVRCGADILEIGIPYSDPLCDGVIFQRACQRALDTGITPTQVLDGVVKMRSKIIDTPIFITSYYGPIFKYGVEKFVKKVKHIGVQGLIIPDILLEEQGELIHAANKFRISVVQFATPYSTEKRLEEIVSYAQGFLYCLSVAGVTGVRDSMGKQIVDLLARVRRVLKRLRKTLPVFVGFGISSPAHIRIVTREDIAGVIVGSALAKLYEKNIRHPHKMLLEIGSFTKLLKAATIQEDNV